MIARWLLAFCQVKDAVIIHTPPDWDNIAYGPSHSLCFEDYGGGQYQEVRAGEYCFAII
jgi:hypothetical protein